MTKPDRVRQYLRPRGAQENGHDPEHQWWYYQRPRRPSPDFEEELRQAGFL